MIAPGNSLTIADGTFNFSGSLNLDLLEDPNNGNQGSSINLSDKTEGYWAGGNLSIQTGYGTIYVYGGSTLNIVKHGGRTGAHLVIGSSDPEGKNTSEGTLNFATVGNDRLAGQSMDENLKLENNATLKNHGIVSFNQSVGSKARGGIRGGGFSDVENFGTMNRKVPDAAVTVAVGTIPVEKVLLNIAVPVIRNAKGAEFNLGAKCGINFSGAGGLNLKQGTFKAAPGAKY